MRPESEPPTFIGIGPAVNRISNEIQQILDVDHHLHKPQRLAIMDPDGTGSLNFKVHSYRFDLNGYQDNMELIVGREDTSPATKIRNWFSNEKKHKPPSLIVILGRHDPEQENHDRFIFEQYLISGGEVFYWPDREESKGFSRLSQDFESEKGAQSADILNKLTEALGKFMDPALEVYQSSLNNQ